MSEHSAITKLEIVPLRKAFPNEAHNLTPGLAKNLDALGERLDIGSTAKNPPKPLRRIIKKGEPGHDGGSEAVAVAVAPAAAPASAADIPISKDFYLRYGPWCECERSCNTHTTVLEEGVSAYECQEAGPNRWRRAGAAKDKNNPTLKGPSGWFLVRGQRLSTTGGDGEPLLRPVVVVAEVEWDEKTQTFREILQEKPHMRNHPDYPKCKCESLDDVSRDMI